MRAKRFHPAVQGQLEEFYAARLGGGAGGKVVDEAGILEVFQPAPMADEVIAMLYTETIKMIPMFSCLQNEVIAQLCLRLQNMPALKGAPVTIEGNVGKCMYIVNSGRLQKWKRAKSVPVMARCCLSSDRNLAYDVSLTSQFWAELFDPVEADAAQQRDMTTELEGLKMSELRTQMEAEGVTPEDIDIEMDSGSEKDSKKLAVKLCVERTSGGSIMMDQSGAEAKPELQHRALDRQPTLMTGTCRHSSSHHYKSDVPIKRARFFVDFDPTEGEASDRIAKGDTAQVLEVRQGNVLSYLTDGDYTGEGCFLDSDSNYRYEETTTAMVNSDLCYLLKSDVDEVKEIFPEIEVSIRTVMNGKMIAEGPKRIFGEASGGDGDLSPEEMKELLITQMNFTEGAELDQLIRGMTQNGNEGTDQFEFVAWYRAQYAAEQASYRHILCSTSLGTLVEWVATAHMEDVELAECLDSMKPQEALVDKILSTPRLFELVHKDHQSERDHYMRYLKRELGKNSKYLAQRLNPVNGVWIARNPQLDRQLLHDVLNGPPEPALESVTAKPFAGAPSRQDGTSTAPLDELIDRVLAQASLIVEMRQDEDLARQATGHEPVQRLLFSTAAEFNTIVLRSELEGLTLGALYAYARDEGIEMALIKEALQHQQPVARLIDEIKPKEVRPLPTDADETSGQEVAENRDRFHEVRQEIESGALSNQNMLELLGKLGQLQQQLQQQLATRAGE
jgi:hypothetical protein